MDLGIRGKWAVVTGAGRGIGRSIAVALAQEGARVFLAGRTPAHLKAVLAALPGRAEKHAAFAADLTSDKGLTGLCRKVKSVCGDPHILVHNLGGSLAVTDPLAPGRDWQKVWRFNVGVAAELNGAFAPGMAKRRWGRIVHVSSLAAATGHGYPAYVSAKAALNGYVKAVSRALAKDNVIVSAIAPGAVRLENRYFALLEKNNPAALAEYYRNHLAMGRLGRPEEIAAGVCFLCSEQASLAAGSIVAMDGGA